MQEQADFTGLAVPVVKSPAKYRRSSKVPGAYSVSAAPVSPVDKEVSPQPLSPNADLDLLLFLSSDLEPAPAPAPSPALAPVVVPLLFPAPTSQLGDDALGAGGEEAPVSISLFGSSGAGSDAGAKKAALGAAHSSVRSPTHINNPKRSGSSQRSIERSTFAGSLRSFSEPVIEAGPPKAMPSFPDRLNARRNSGGGGSVAKTTIGDGDSSKNLK